MAQASAAPARARSARAHPCGEGLSAPAARQAQSNENVSPGVIMSVAKELRKLSNEPLDGIKVGLNEEDVTDICADITGPGTLGPPSRARARAPSPSPLPKPQSRRRPCRRIQPSPGLTDRAHGDRAQMAHPSRGRCSRSSWCCRLSTRPRRPRVRRGRPRPSVPPWAYPARSLPRAVLAPCAAGYFLTKIFHPNISKTGDICVNTLKKDWKSDLGLGHVLQVRSRAADGHTPLRFSPPPDRARHQDEPWARRRAPPPQARGRRRQALTPPARPRVQVVRCLLINPFPESALNDEAGKLFMEDYATYFKKAQMMSQVHAGRASSSSSKPVDASATTEPATTEGEPVEKRQKPVENKAAEKRRLQQKKSLKRL
eukprot:1719921-Prymnesium_polylepis.1